MWRGAVRWAAGGGQSLPVDAILVFHHIPKTAGTSLRQWLAQQCPEGAFRELYGPHRDSVRWYETFYASLTDAERSALRCVSGHTCHFMIPVLEKVQRPFRVYVMLRDPVERVVSLFYFVKRLANKDEGRGSAVAREIARRNWSLIDIYRHLGSGGERSSALHELFKYFFDGQSRHILAPHMDTSELTYGEYQGGRLEQFAFRVKDVLARYYDVGLVEKYGDSLSSLADAMNWRRPLEERVNVNPLRPALVEIPGETRAMIRAHNSIDCVLHDEFLRGLGSKGGGES